MPYMKARLRLIALFSILAMPLLIDEKGEPFRGLASSWTIIPSRSLAGLHYIFKGYQIEDERNLVKVTGPVIEITNGETLGAKVHREGFFNELDLEDFEEEQELGLSVFEATTGSGRDVGTAFLVGQSLVLTNRHVLGLSAQARKWECGKFSVRLNHKSEIVSCERVRFCSRRFDFCVVELGSLSNGNSLGHEVKPLRLSKNVKTSKDELVLHIGNAAGLGIQASSGKGLTVKDGEVFHYAPTLGGSSGAPLFNEKGLVVGMNWAHTGGNYIDERSFNRGVLMETIYRELSVHRSSLLNEIKSFKSWHHREQSHRQVKIQTSSETVRDEVSSSQK